MFISSLREQVYYNKNNNEVNIYGKIPRNDPSRKETFQLSHTVNYAGRFCAVQVGLYARTVSRR
jgi:hypothetical protein